MDRTRSHRGSVEAVRRQMALLSASELALAQESMLEVGLLLASALGWVTTLGPVSLLPLRSVSGLVSAVRWLIPLVSPTVMWAMVLSALSSVSASVGHSLALLRGRLSAVRHPLRLYCSWAG